MKSEEPLGYKASHPQQTFLMEATNDNLICECTFNDQERVCEVRYTGPPDTLSLCNWVQYLQRLTSSGYKYINHYILSHNYLLCKCVSGGGGGVDTHLSTGKGVPLEVQNLTLSQTARRTKKYTLSHYTLVKTLICIPCSNIAHIGYTLSYCCFTVKRN